MFPGSPSAGTLDPLLKLHCSLLFRLAVDSSVGRPTRQEENHDHGVSTIWFLLFYLIYMHEQVSNRITPSSLPKVRSKGQLIQTSINYKIQMWVLKVN